MDRQTNPVCCLTYPVLSVLLTSNLKLLKKFLVGNTDRPDSNEDYSLDLEVGGDSESEGHEDYSLDLEVGGDSKSEGHEDYSLDLEVGGDSESEEESEEEYVQVLMDSPKLNDSRLDS